jgi:hypothetical protein
VLDTKAMINQPLLVKVRKYRQHFRIGAITNGVNIYLPTVVRVFFE